MPAPSTVFFLSTSGSGDIKKLPSNSKDLRRFFGLGSKNSFD